MKKSLLSILTVFIFTICAYAQGDVYLSLYATGKRSDIAIESFTSPYKTTDDIKYAALLKEVIENDLILCRYFNVIVGDPVENMPFEGRMLFWEKKGGSVLITGSVRVKLDQITFDVKLYDVVTREIIWKDTYKKDTVNYRLLAHEVSDEIVRRFTGENGVACSKIAFINNSTRFKELYLIDYDGHNLRRLTRNKPIYFRDGL